MPVRTEVALPAAMAFVFGAAVGLVTGHLVTKGGQVKPGIGAAQAVAPAGVPASAEPPVDPAAERARREAILVQHESLLTASPDDIDLLRTVANYRAALEDQAGALEAYERALAGASAKGASAAVRAGILTDRGIVRAEGGDMAGALKDLADAAALDTADTRSRLAQVYLYVMRVMPSPPPGFTRQDAVARAEALLAEIRALSPDDPDAARFQGLIDAVRERMGRAKGAEPPAP